MEPPWRPRFEHLAAMTDGVGLFEHANGREPRLSCGYCTDDVARALILGAVTEAMPAQLMRCYRAFVLAAVAPDGRCHNRRDTSGAWTDAPALGDWWGRALWGLGLIAADDPEAMDAVARLAGRRSPDRRAMAYAGLGAVELLGRLPGAESLLRDAVAQAVPPTPRPPSWPWPEPRLTYDNAVIPLLALRAGAAWRDAALIRRGLELGRWLVAQQWHQGHLAPVPVGGYGPGERRRRFDQQPIELAALAWTARVAHELTGDAWWATVLASCAGWFAGDNDTATPLFDPETGAGYDGLMPGGRNENCGAESTICANLTLALADGARGLGPAASPGGVLM